MIPDEVKKELSTAKSDLEACRILMDHGVDLTAIEKKIAEAGFGPIKLGLQELSDDALADAAGGFSRSVPARMLSASAAPDIKKTLHCRHFLH